MEVMEYTSDILGEKTFEITVKKAKEAKRIQRRIERRGLCVPIDEKTLTLSVRAIELKRRIFKKRGYIAEKYKEQIKAQL